MATALNTSHADGISDGHFNRYIWFCCYGIVWPQNTLKTQKEFLENYYFRENSCQSVAEKSEQESLIHAGTN
jgi:hypothetical protein